MTVAVKALQDFWRRAAKHGEAKSTPLSLKEARRLRCRLYSAVIKVRRDPSLDPELGHALDLCQVRLKETLEGWIVIVAPAADDPILQAIDNDAESEAEASLRRLQEMGLDMAPLPPAYPDEE